MLVEVANLTRHCVGEKRSLTARERSTAFALSMRPCRSRSSAILTALSLVPAPTIRRLGPPFPQRRPVSQSRASGTQAVPCAPTSRRRLLRSRCLLALKTIQLESTSRRISPIGRNATVGPSVCGRAARRIARSCTATRSCAASTDGCGCSVRVSIWAAFRLEHSCAVGSRACAPNACRRDRGTTHRPPAISSEGASRRGRGAVSISKSRTLSSHQTPCATRQQQQIYVDTSDSRRARTLIGTVPRPTSRGGGRIRLPSMEPSSVRFGSNRIRRIGSAVRASNRQALASEKKKPPAH
jgi:hypothetical protein